MNILLDLFFKYSLNNFLHAQVKECIRLVFAWNNLSLPPNEALKSPTAVVRVKTPPTVEMIDPQSEEENSDEKKEEDKKDEASGGTDENPSNEEANQETNEDPSSTEDEPAYDNPLLVDVSIIQIDFFSGFSTLFQ